VRIGIIALSRGVQVLFDGAALWLPCVNRDWAGQAAGPAMSAMPRKRRLAVKMSPVEKGPGPAASTCNKNLDVGPSACSQS
jgi:hypothetical protein